jgi:hypothetical protein
MVRPIFSSRITDTFQNVLGNIALLAPWCTSVNGSNTYDRRMPEHIGSGLLRQHRGEENGLRRAF